MSQQYPQEPQLGAPQQPTQPGYGYPQQSGWGAPPSQPPKRKTGKILGIIGAVFVGLIVIGSVAGGGDDSTDAADSSNKDKAVAATSDKPKAAEEAADKPAEGEPAADKSQAEQFKDCVAKSGTATEKEAVKHVTKVTGTDEQNDILDAAEVFTDYTGGLIGPHASDGKLIASAFASCYESDNGLVTVYDAKGELLSNGNY
ncbi:hypothetical protein [Streptomyces sp. NPDC098781]|uniref:hypothetical protein n=1 Tax=Streptomyces sp. NPDC098781 TaxID=3366097 RepID=UPI0037F4A559